MPEGRNRIVVESLDAIDDAAARFLELVPEDGIIAFYAPMGAGKTTFISALCRAMGVSEDAVSSPTFSIVNEYLTASGRPVYHFDFYRIEKIAEALDIGYYDYIDSGRMCLMEWPENIEDLLPEETIKVSIHVLPEGAREISF